MKKIRSLSEIKEVVKPLAEKYQIAKVYLFGSYARNEANDNSDMDFLIYGDKNFKSVNVFAFAEELRLFFNNSVDVFAINEINKESPFYKNIMKDRIAII